MRDSRPALPRLEPAFLRRLSLLDERRGLGYVALEWASIGVAVTLSEAFWHPALYALAVIWIGARQHALLILAHDGAHRLIVRNPRWNDWISEIFLAWPVMVAFHSYRNVHRLHHVHLNSEADPDWARNRPDRLIGAADWRKFGLVMLGLSWAQWSLLRWLGAGDRQAETEPSSSWPLFRLLYYGGILGALAALDALALLGLYWVVPLCSWYLLSLRLKGAAEHFALPNLEPCNSSRTIRATLLESWLLAPHTSSYHIEHHLYPGIPHYRLGQLHAGLMKLPEFTQRAHVTGSYFAFLLEAIGIAWLPKQPAAAEARPSGDL